MSPSDVCTRILKLKGNRSVGRQEDEGVGVRQVGERKKKTGARREVWVRMVGEDGDKYQIDTFQFVPQEARLDAVGFVEL